MNIRRKSQTVTTDLLIVVFLLLVGISYVVVGQIERTSGNQDLDKKYQIASNDAKIIFETLRKDGIIDEINRVDMERLSQLDEEQLREELNIRGDFAIAFEKEGRLVRVSSQRNCIGSSKIIVSDIPCG